MLLSSVHQHNIAPFAHGALGKIEFLARYPNRAECFNVVRIAQGGPVASSRDDTRSMACIIAAVVIDGGSIVLTARSAQAAADLGALSATRDLGNAPRAARSASREPPTSRFRACRPAPPRAASLPP